MPKKRIREEKYEVELTKNMAGTPDTKTQDITAKDGSEAVRKAKSGDSTQYDEINVRKTGIGSRGAPKTAPIGAEPTNTVSRTAVETKKRRKKIDPHTFELTEGYLNTKFTYDYAIVLPVGYRKFVEGLRRGNKNLIVEAKYGRVHIVVSSPEIMDKMIVKLISASRGRIKENRQKAKTLLFGIMRSMK